jgi:hypothetical protein
MKKKFCGLLMVTIIVFTGRPARADLFGGDVAVLVQILAESIKQYYQLKELIGRGKSTEEFLRLVNSGIDNSMGLLLSLPVKDEGLLSDLESFKQALSTIENIYGGIPKSKEQVLHLLNDQTVAESLRMANSFKKFSADQEENSARIAVQSRQASPKGAARMQAETSAQILRSLSQLIRVNTQMLKLQSEQFALQNKHGKTDVASYQRVNDGLSNGFKNFKLDMNLGKF